MATIEGVYSATVTDNRDPEGLGRVRLRVAGLTDGTTAADAWARVATPMAGANRGAWFLPEAGDEVLVAFEHGDPRVPYVVGALWNAKARPPATPANAQAGMRMIRSHNGVTVTIEDDAARRALVLETPAGQRITLDDSAAIRIEDATGNRITLTSAGIRIESSSRVTVAAPSVEVDAGQVTVNAGMSRFSGVVQCDTLIATSVVAQSYTPGAGNIS